MPIDTDAYPPVALVCSACRTEADPGSAFCVSCGNALSRKTQSVSRESIEWYYQLNGARIGPAGASEISYLVSRGVIGGATNVWTQGMTTWLPLRSTSLATIVTLPPPLVAVSNTLVWWLAFMPIIGIVVEFGVASTFHTRLNSVWWISVIPNSILAIWDNTTIRKAGNRVGVLWAFFLVPVYLFRRSAIVDQNYGYSITWVFSFIVSLVLGVVFALALLHVRPAF